MGKKNVIKKSPLVPTILISGGAGFIGYYLTEAFLEKGARVVVCDDLSQISTKRITAFVSNPKFALFDTSSTSLIPPQIESVDYVIHIGDLESYFLDKDLLDLDTLLVNSQSLKHLLDLATKSSAKFLLLSTIDVNEGNSISKNVASLFGSDTLDASTFKTTDARKLAEAIVWEHSKRFGTNVRIVRIPYLYGPKMDLDACGSLGSMLRDLIHHQDIIVYGNENRKEFYLYITDAINGIIKSLFNPNTKNKTYTLLGEDPHKVLTTAFLLRNMADRRTEVDFKDSAKNFDKDLNISVSKGVEDIDWWPQYSLKEGIIVTLEHFGYKVNNNSFKPTELITKKDKELTSSLLLDSISLDSSTELTSSTQDKSKISSNINKANSRFNLLSILGKNQINIFSLFKNIFKNAGKITGINRFFSQSPAIILSLSAVLVSAFIIFIVSPLINFNSGILNTYESLQKAESSLYNLDFENAQKETLQAEQQLTKARTYFTKSKWFYTLIFGSEGYSSINNSLISLNHFLKASHDLTLALDPYKNFWTVLHPDSEEFLNVDEIKKSQAYIISADSQMQLAKANLSYVNRDKLPKKILPLFDKYESYVDKFSEHLHLFSVTSADLPTLLGMESPKTYLIWFQNSNEIRPTGGFIGSYGVLTVDKGKLVGLTIDDIYNPDGQITLRNIKTPLPSPLANSLGEDRMYLRNSNWSPDFMESAKSFSDLYSKVTGVTPDGIIAVDLYFVKNLLFSLGPIYLASYDEEINAQNLYERAQFHSDFNYQNGRSEKKTFLTVLSGKLLEKLFSLQSNELNPLINAVTTSLNEKHLLLTFTNSTANILLSRQNWNGNLIQTDKDYLYIVNSNIGGTKANYYVKNSYDYKITSQTRDGLLRANLLLTYNHTGKDMSWPGGPYKNYLRVLVKKGVRLTGATINYGTGSVQNIMPQIILDRVGEYETFEYMFTLNPSEKVTININYDLPQNLSINSSYKEYGLVWQKQPGTQDDNISFEFVPPFGMEVLSSDISSTPQTAFTDILNVDKKVSLKLK